MIPNSVADIQASRWSLAAGASRQVVLRACATVVCVSGCVRVDEPVTGPQAPDGLPLAMSARLHAGEGHGLAYGGVARITAIDAAEVICLDRPGLAARLWRLASAFLGARMAQKQKNSLGALHKISK